MGIRGSFPGCKAAGAWSWPLPSSAEVKEWMELYLHSPNTPSWRGAQLKHKDTFTFVTFSKDLLVISKYILVTRRHNTPNLLCVCFQTNLPTSLLQSFCILLGIYIFTQYINITAQTRSCCVPFNFKPSWFPWTFLIPYSKAKLKAVRSDKAMKPLCTIFSATVVTSDACGRKMSRLPSRLAW
jgi:hypothetical protein